MRQIFSIQGSDVLSFFENGILQPVFAIIIKETEPEKAEKLESKSIIASNMKKWFLIIIKPAIKNLDSIHQASDFGIFAFRYTSSTTSESFD